MCAVFLSAVDISKYNLGYNVLFAIFIFLIEKDKYGAIMGHTGDALIPGIEWEITTRCNYRCSYCSQKQYSSLLWKDCSDEVVESVYEILRGSGEPWLVKLAGGEPFVHPRFLEICRWLVKSSHRVCTTTNFSAPERKLDEFITATGDSLEYVVASLHPSQVKDIDGYIEKARYFQSAKRPATKFTVTSVAVEENMDVLKYAASRLTEYGVRFEVAPLKNNGSYVEPESSEFSEFAGRWVLKSVKEIKHLRSMGTVCHTGRKFCRITTEGDVLRCYNLQPLMYMGNVKDGTFNWFDSVKPCLALKCTCTVPANRNLIEFGNVLPIYETVRQYNAALMHNMPGMLQLSGKWAGRSLKNILSRK